MNIIELNKDVEKHVLNSSGVTFVHFSDVHARPKLWDRIVEYINNYPQISFALHTGDYCGGSQKVYADMYQGKACRCPIYNCVGNHDCYSGEGAWLLNEKSVAYNLLFNHIENWDATFFNIPYSMCYYKDFENLRIIVLDDYYDIWQNRQWLRKILKDAYEKNIHVLTAQHEPTGYIEHPLNTNFQTFENLVEKHKKGELERVNFDFDHRARVLYEDVIGEFISYGGKYICNIAGHDHNDQIGFTDKGILNIAIQNATSWDGITDTQRVIGERSEDCFNVMSVDTSKNTFKLVRIGANTDRLGRCKKMLVYDYKNKKILKEE